MPLSPSNQDPLVAQFKAEVESTRTEFNAAREELSRACKIVPDIGKSTSDGAVLWDRANTRYKRAERAYSDALKRFADQLHSPRL